MGLRKKGTKSCCCGGNYTPEAMAQAEATGALWRISGTRQGIRIVGTDKKWSGMTVGHAAL